MGKLRPTRHKVSVVICQKMASCLATGLLFLPSLPHLCPWESQGANPAWQGVSEAAGRSTGGVAGKWVTPWLGDACARPRLSWFQPGSSQAPPAPGSTGDLGNGGLGTGRVWVRQKLDLAGVGLCQQPSASASASIQFCPLFQSPFVATVSFILTKAQEERWAGELAISLSTPSTKAMQRAWCGSFVTVSLFTGGETEAQRGAGTCFRLQSQRGVTGSAPIQGAPPTTTWPPVLLHSQVLRCSATKEIGSYPQPHFPGWAASRLGFPSGKAPRLFCMVRRTREEMTKILLERAAENSPTFGLQGVGVASGSAKVGVQMWRSKGAAGRQPWNLDLERHWLWTEVGQGWVPLLLISQ